MKYIIYIGILLTVCARAYSHDSVSQSTLRTIVKEFSNNSIRLTCYKRLPKFIRNYLDGRQEKKFRISNSHFNATDAGPGIRRKLYYLEKKGNKYILSYEHGGLGTHFHSIIFETNGKEIMHVYNLTTIRHKHISDLLELIEKRMYNIYDIEV